MRVHATALESLVAALETAPDTAVRTLEVLPEAERQQVVVRVERDGGRVSAGASASMSCSRTGSEEPEATAVVYEEER